LIEKISSCFAQSLELAVPILDAVIHSRSNLSILTDETWEPRNMKKFLVTYLAPASVIAEWKRTDPDTRKAAEEKMHAEWKKWMNDHANMFADIGAGVGKTKAVTAQGVSDSKNDIMLYSLVEAESHEAAAKSFEGHPHLQIPQSSIEIMEVHALPGMK
jgi:hypothetical protein